VKLAPSPALRYRNPSGPKFMSPIEWLGYCWHQLPEMSGTSVPVMVGTSTTMRESRP
jgi:hypothetical protein